MTAESQTFSKVPNPTSTPWLNPAEIIMSLAATCLTMPILMSESLSTNLWQTSRNRRASCTCSKSTISLLFVTRPWKRSRLTLTSSKKNTSKQTPSRNSGSRSCTQTTSASMPFFTLGLLILGLLMTFDLTFWVNLYLLKLYFYCFSVQSYLDLSLNLLNWLKSKIDCQRDQFLSKIESEIANWSKLQKISDQRIKKEETDETHRKRSQTTPKPPIYL